MDFIAWIQQTELHRWLAESPDWFPYPFIIALHAMGMGVIVGMNVALDLRIPAFPWRRWRVTSPSCGWDSP